MKLLHVLIAIWAGLLLANVIDAWRQSHIVTAAAHASMSSAPLLTRTVLPGCPTPDIPPTWVTKFCDVRCSTSDGAEWPARLDGWCYIDDKGAVLWGVCQSPDLSERWAAGGEVSCPPGWNYLRVPDSDIRTRR